MGYAQVVVEVEPYHLDRPFDYAIPDDLEHPVLVGSRVEVVFGGRRRRGLVVALIDAPSVAPERVLPIRRVFGPHQWMTPAEIELARWAATRFGAPMSDVVRHALPGRVVDVERRAASAGWFPPGAAARPTPPPAPTNHGWDVYGPGGRAIVAAVTAASDPATTAAAPEGGAFFWRPLPGEDLGARLAELVQLTLAADRDVLLVVPDPDSPAADAVVAAAADLAVDARGGPSQRVAYKRWLQARCGDARIVVGERGSVWWPLHRLGLAIVLDEANPAHKERRSPRHHVREIVLERARRAGAVAILAGYVPSAPAWRLLSERRLQPAVADRATERRHAPLTRVDDGRGGPRTRIGALGTRALRAALDEGAYGIVLASRRGEGRALVCSRCGTLETCPRCGSSLAPRPGRDPRVHCEGCGWVSPGRPRCAKCQGERFTPLAAGAERIGSELARTFRDDTVAVLEGYAAIPPPPPAVLVTTRGSVLDTPPGPVGAVVLPDLDGQLRRPALDAAEDALRLSMQVASWTVANLAPTAGPGRAGRAPAGGGAERPLVVLQTREPDHPAVQALIRWDPGGFWRAETANRAPLRFPPAAFAIRITAEGRGVDEATTTTEIRDHLASGDDLLGPIPDEGRLRYLVKCDDRVATLAALDPLRRTWSRAGLDTRVDVDPVDVE